MSVARSRERKISGPLGGVLRVVLLGAGLAVALIGAELGIRRLQPQQTYGFEKGLFTPVPEHGYALSPGLVKTHAQPEYIYRIRSNSHGFRGPEPDFQAPRRVLVLGDSFGMGQGVPEGRNLCEVARSRMREAGEDVEVFNTSISGYGGINQVGVLGRFIGEYRPQLTVLLFYWNDIGLTETLKVRDGYLVLAADRGNTGRVSEWLNHHSHLYSLAKKQVYRYRSGREPVREGGGKLPRAGLESALGFIGKMKAIASSGGSDLVVVLLPLEGILEGSRAFRESRNDFARQLGQAGVAVVDWSLELPPGDRSRYVYRLDGHWNEAGHAYFGELLQRLLRERLAPRSAERLPEEGKIEEVKR